MTGKEILEQRAFLETQILEAARSFERKDDLKNLKKDFFELQRKCPHYDSELNLEPVTKKDGTIICPYCGGKIL